MKIIKRRIRRVAPYLVSIPTGDNFYVTLTNLPSFTTKLTSIGFNPPIIGGQQVLPKAIGSVTKYNANGKFIIHRNQPKVTDYREAVIKDWRGNYHTVDIPFLRYPRTPLPPPAIELLVRTDATGSLIISSPLLTNDAASEEKIKHIINVFLECFGECDIFTSNLLPSFNVPVTKLNWNILPPGNYPWATLQPTIQGIINTASSQTQQIVEARIKKISDYSPDFVGVGKAGFHGYIIFGFSSKNIFVLESIYTNNATYVLGQNWQTISQLTKDEILNQSLHQQRIIHTSGWVGQIDALLT